MSPYNERDRDFDRGRDERYSSRSPSPNHRRYYDRDGERNGDSRTWRNSRSRSPSPIRGVPSKDIMLQGLDLDVTESDLTKAVSAIDSRFDRVTIIRDRHTKQSRKFGFIRFTNVDDAKDFMEKHYPFITCNSARIRIAYSKDSKYDTSDEGWICKVCGIINYPRRSECYRCNSVRRDAEGGTAPTTAIRQNQSSQSKINNGSGDIGDSASQFLMFRNLASSTNEETIASALSSISSSVVYRRILLVRDRDSKQSWCFAFVEFLSASECTKALEIIKKVMPLKIDESNVKIDFIHPGVFVPVYSHDTDDSRNFTFLSSNGSSWLTYWDERAYLSIYTNPALQQNDLKEVSALSSASLFNNSTVSQDLSNQQASSPQNSGETRQKYHNSTSSTSAASISTPAVTVPKHMAPQLQRWQLKQAELHGGQAGISNDDTNGTSTSATAIDDSNDRENQEKQVSFFQESFSDPTQHACILCMRKFESGDKVNRHERMSELHAFYLSSKEARERARKKLAKHAGRAASESAQYRDRAKERRIAAQQSSNVATIDHKNISSKDSNEKATIDHSIRGERGTGDYDDDDDDDDMFLSKGSKLLEKMGWKSGSALGSTETGIQEPVQPVMYSQGVGLGADEGKLDPETEGKPKTYASFIDQVRNKTKQRYENK
ncbi:hypothetical protein V1511DRAFT_520482 [Dipodascopsis uninucleata]